MNTDYDIGIIGAGIVGTSLACALAGTGLRIALLEPIEYSAKNQAGYDDKGLALSLSSQRILDGIGAWEQVVTATNPIRHIHVSDRGQFGFVRLDAAAMGLEALGHVVMARELGQVLISRVKQAGNVDLLCPAEVTGVAMMEHMARLTIAVPGGEQKITCKLLAVADGTHSDIRQQLGINIYRKDYKQTAIVANVTPEFPHNDTAYERFTEHGPIAVLPLAERHCVVVLTVDTDIVDETLALDDDQYLRQIYLQFGKRLGRFLKVGRRKSYPLMLVNPEEQIRDRVVLLGNAAHTIHPNGAQGLNLALRDVAGLAEKLIHAAHYATDPGSRQLLEAYLADRSADQKRVIRLSDGLARVFYSRRRINIFARNMGMLMIDLIPAIKMGFTRQAVGLRGRQPALVRSERA